MNSGVVTISGTDANAFVSAVNALTDSDLQAVKLSGGEVRLRSKTGSVFTLTDGGRDTLGQGRDCRENLPAHRWRRLHRRMAGCAPSVESGRDSNVRGR